MAATVPPEVAPVATAGPRLVGGDAPLVRRTLVVIVGFATIVAIVRADWWWIALAVLFLIAWDLERRTYVQCTGTHVVVQNRCARHEVARNTIDGLDVRHGITGARAELVLTDGRRLAVVSWALIEPSAPAVDAMLRRLGTDLDVTSRARPA